LHILAFLHGGFYFSGRAAERDPRVHTSGGEIRAEISLELGASDLKLDPPRRILPILPGGFVFSTGTGPLHSMAFPRLAASVHDQRPPIPRCCAIGDLTAQHLAAD
jgi:hypothetical protein